MDVCRLSDLDATHEPQRKWLTARHATGRSPKEGSSTPGKRDSHRAIAGFYRQTLLAAGARNKEQVAADTLNVLVFVGMEDIYHDHVGQGCVFYLALGRDMMAVL